MITDILLAAATVVALALSYTLGKHDGSKVRPAPPVAVCPCSHTIGEHKEMGTCKAQVKRKLYSTVGDDWGYEYVNCACTKYHGPVPIPTEFFNPGTFVQ